MCENADARRPHYQCRSLRSARRHIVGITKRAGRVSRQGECTVHHDCQKIETLDQALLRPGRIDYRLYLGKAAEEQKIELYRRFFPRASMSGAREFVETYHSAETMAEFQGLL